MARQDTYADLGAEPASGDLYLIRDVSDTTMNALGTTKEVAHSDVIASVLLKSGGAMTGDIACGGNKITDSIQPLAPIAVTASRSLALTDARQGWIEANHATVAIVLTVPTNASVAFPVGTVLNIERVGAAAVSVAAAGGVTVNKPSDRSLSARAQYSVLSLRKRATDTWTCLGDLT